MLLKELKNKVCGAIDERRGEIISLGREIQNNPETGFKEFNTSSLVKGKFEEIGLKYEDGLAITGLKAKIGEGNINVGVFGELDALVCPNHPLAVGGVAHACGHFAQIANMIGVGFGLIDSGAMKYLNGSVTLFAVPAEEGIEYGYRRKLVEEGKLGFVQGKQELIRLGELDDVDVAMMCHAEGTVGERMVWPRISTNGSIIKFVKYIGKQAHWTGAPWEGINALNAAILGLQAVNALAETFRDEDSVRVTPMIRRGGESENVVPDDVRVTSYVKAKSIDALVEVNEKVDRAFQGGAYSLGCDIEIEDIPNFMPLTSSDVLSELFIKNCSKFVKVIDEPIHKSWSTDMGDISQIIPAIHPLVGGFAGGVHTEYFKVIDEEMSFIIPAKIMAMTIVDLLFDKLDERVSEERKRKISKDKYLSLMRSLKKVTHEQW